MYFHKNELKTKPIIFGSNPEQLQKSTSEVRGSPILEAFQRLEKGALHHS
jgi:hypothetical protein